MKTLTKACSVLAVALLWATGVAAVAQPGQEPGPGFGMRRPPMERMLGSGGEKGRWWNNPKVADQLKLTDDQRKSMDDILQQHMENLVDMRGNLEKAELGMQPLMSQDQPNESAILAQIDKVAQARAELEKANARFLLALRAKLTPDQWKALQTMRAERHERMGRGDWRKGGPQGPPPPGGQPGEPQSAPGNPPQEQ
ncbi:MAG TPA: Spy/CpxP family protein refolding chaperone [Terracidiphilus sp.]|nr:Spy/CpxP family protein refolding chaperone [Terracidiphilus sp.]